VDASRSVAPTQGGILVLDFGSQFAQLIARRVRELNVHAELIPFDTPLSEMLARRPAGIIMSGSPSSVYDDAAPKPDPALWTCGLPILGICYGVQLMAQQLGGEVGPSSRREYGPADIRVADQTNLLLTGVAASDGTARVWMSHGDSITKAPAGFTSIANTDSTPFAALADTARNLWGIQFHPEVVHTPTGKRLLSNFVREIAKAEANWTPGRVAEDAIATISQQVGPTDRVLCALSGGVDSAVAAALIHRAIGNRLVCVYVDHGLMRKRESDLLREVFANTLGMTIHMVDAKERFLVALSGVDDPEEKRKIIGREFIRVFEEESKKLGEFRFLAQGTLYPDVIESTSKETKAAQKIKTHHNVGGLPDDLTFELVEPLRALFKDEVRAVGLELGLPESVVLRQPFPGPGLAIRILGDVTKERLDILREADWIVVDEIKKAGLYRTIWQSFAVLTPMRSVGVMGDGRTYGNVLAVRAVTSEDGMTADWARLPYDLIERISARIVNEVSGVTRVVYDVTSKPPATIEWE
jgi:GMP synthase (glutamine-hydrolysing)